MAQGLFMQFDEAELIRAFATIGAYCISRSSCTECRLKELCEGQLEDALYEFALHAALTV